MSFIVGVPARPLDPPMTPAEADHAFAVLLDALQAKAAVLSSDDPNDLDLGELVRADPADAAD